MFTVEVESEPLARAARGTGVLASQNATNAILGALFFMFMARTLTKTEMGVYGAVGLAYSIVVIVGGLGLDSAASRFIPYFYGQKDLFNARLVAKRVILISSLSASLLSLIYFVFSTLLSDLMLGTPFYANVFQVAAVLIFVNILSFMVMGFLQGLQRFTHLAFFKLIAQVVRIVISVWLLLLGLGVTAIFLGFFFFFVTIVGIATPPLIKELFKGSNIVKSKNSSSFTTRSLLVFAIPLMGYSIIDYASRSVDQFIVLGLIGVSALGVYTVAITGASFILIVLALPLLSTLIPIMSEFHGRTGIDAVSGVFTLSSRYLALLFIPLSLGLAALSPLAVDILAGSRYVEAASSLAIVSIAISISGFSAAIISALTAIGETRKITYSITIASAAGLIANVGLAPLFGVSGAALSRALTYLIMLIFLVYMGSRVMPILFDKKAVTGSLFSSSVMATFLYFLGSLTGFSLFFLPIYLISALTIYVLALSALRILTLNDVIFIRKVIPGGDDIFNKTEKMVNDSIILSKIARKLLNC